MILSVKDLSVSFDELNVLENVNFEVSPGDILAIIGSNGSGKTVLLRALLHTIPYQGQIEWKKGVRIGYVPQKLFIDWSLPLTLREFLNLKAKIIGTSADEVEEVLSLVKLPGSFLDRPLAKLSGGQFQRALIAFAMIGDPNVLIFDEPTASVDTPSSAQIYEDLHRLCDQRKMTLLIVSHDLSLIYSYANKVLCLNKQNLCFGHPAEVLTPERLHELYGTPVKFYVHEHQFVGEGHEEGHEHGHEHHHHHDHG